MLTTESPLDLVGDVCSTEIAGYSILQLTVGAFAIAGVIGGVIADLLPGISSPGQVAVFLTMVMPLNSLSYLSTIASVSTSQTIFSLATASSIDKTRNGGIEWLSQVINIGENLIFLLLLMFLAVSITVAVVFLLRKKIGRIANIDMEFINRLLIVYLIAIVFVTNGIFGILIMLFASILGYLTIKLGAPRTHLMGAVIIPTLLLLFRIFI